MAKPKLKIRVLSRAKPKATKLTARELKAVAARCAEAGKANDELKKFVADGMARLTRVPA